MFNQWLEGIGSAIGLQPWALTVFLIVLAALLLDFLQRRIMLKLENVVSSTSMLWDDALFRAVRRPLTLVIWLVGLSLAAQAVPVGDDDRLLGSELITSLRQVGVLYAIAWFLVGFVLQLEEAIILTAKRDNRTVDRTTVKALGRVIRITVVVTTVLVCLDTLGFNVAGLMAAGGIGGLAVGFAAKDLLANFFGGVTVFIDRPFGIGDWIIIHEKKIEGVVEHIGWRQTTIRKFDKRPVYVPNAVFTTASVENPSRMTHRRIFETIGVRYGDVGSMDKITGEVREMLMVHPEIDQDQTLMVHFNAFAESSLDFFVYCMTHTTVWQHYHEVKQDVLLKIAHIIELNGAAIAFPTRQLEFAAAPQFSGLDMAREPTEDKD